MVFTLVFLSSLSITCFLIPSLISISFRKRLFDAPSESRKVHKRFVPHFGGVAIFSAVLFSSALFIPGNLVIGLNVLLASGLILFMTGLKDDLVGLTPIVKLIAQVVAAGITAVVANLRITDLHGLFDIYQLSYPASIALTTVAIVGIVNAFNLIDGIDGLAGGIGLILSLFYSVLFYKAGDLASTCFSLSVAGALLGFLFFNLTPAKIFMGDAGSLLLGFIAAVLSLRFLQASYNTSIMLGPFSLSAGYGLVLSILIIPVFDTIRVFTLRILKNTSPFTADSNHLHHRLLFLGLTHVQAALLLAVTNVIFIAIALSLQQLGDGQVIGILSASILLLNGALSLLIERQKRRWLANSASSVSGNFMPNDEVISNDNLARKASLKNISQN
jgi:UDP-GlcNAc:undecaprenyl-phosphate GlcNAc-1-phosphate transferase